MTKITLFMSLYTTTYAGIFLYERLVSSHGLLELLLILVY